ncbi:MAG TPA: class II aldolase/adducin family protein [Bryobacteraceae bacterium]|jgi:L-fuculose-phosphate aldolase|nr:class II aldolase/adducin family protein [Bryobacteraceae bacterium]
MSKTEAEYRRDIIEIGKLVFQKGWVAANDGNISIRLDDDRVLCTPTAICKGMMGPDDLIICNMDGCKVQGSRERTSEIAMHLTIYGIRPDVRSVVHAHPPVATGFAAAGRALNMALLPEVVINLGSVPLASYGLPGTPALTAGMLEYIPKYDALLMENHGAVAYGTDVHKAYFNLETVEHFARITLVAELLGGARPLPRVEVQKLFESRERYAVKSNATLEAGAPLVAEDMPARSGSSTNALREEIRAIVEETLRGRGVLA